MQRIRFLIRIAVIASVSSSCVWGYPETIQKPRVRKRHPAAVVVKRFCELDGRGAGNQVGWGPGTQEMLGLMNEPPQDEEGPVIVIDRFRLVKLAATRTSAQVIVRYTVVGILSNATLSDTAVDIWSLKRPKKPREELSYRSRKRGGRWLVFSPIDFPPHVYRATTIKALSDFVKEEENDPEIARDFPGRVESMRNVIKALSKPTEPSEPISRR